eukprot:scaffold7970_cov118-Cylindrotheca_fusiformis.AAC.6
MSNIDATTTTTAARIDFAIGCRCGDEKPEMRWFERAQQERTRHPMSMTPKSRRGLGIGSKKRPMKNKDLYIKVVRGHDDTEVGKAVAAALHFTANEKPGVTTIVVAPEYNPDDFERYLGMVQFLEQVVMDRDEMKLSEYVQIAPFHPLFQLDEDDSFGEKDPIGAYTNRAPYPMFHVIRADDVSDAVDKLDGDPGKVWRRNQRLLKNMGEKMGKEKTIEIVMGRHDEEKDPRQMKLLYEILKQTMIEMKREAKNGEPKQMERGSWER